MRVLVVAACVLLSLPLWAGDDAPEPPPDEPYAKPPKQRAPIQLGGYAGAVDGESPPALVGDGPDVALGFVVARDLGKYVLGELDLMVTVGEFDTPPVVNFGDDDLTLTGGLLFANLKARLPGEKAQPFLGFGFGFGYHQLEADSFFGYEQIRVEDDWGFAKQVMLGVRFRTGKKNWIGFEVRELDVDADFDEISRGEIDVGGRIFAVSYLWVF